MCPWGSEEEEREEIDRLEEEHGRGGTRISPEGLTWRRGLEKQKEEHREQESRQEEQRWQRRRRHQEEELLRQAHLKQLAEERFLARERRRKRERNKHILLGITIGILISAFCFLLYSIFVLGAL